MNAPLSSAPGTGRRQIGDYLRASGPPLQAAIDAHRDLVRQLTPLFSQAATGHAATSAVQARHLGKQYGQLFRQSLQAVQAIVPPSQAMRGHEYLVRWLQFLASAGDALAQAPADGKDPSYLSDCHDYLDDARYAAKALSEIRQRLHEALQKPPAGAPAAPPAPAPAAPTRPRPAAAPKPPPRPTR